MDLNQLFSIAKDETTVGELRRMLAAPDAETQAKARENSGPAKGPARPRPPAKAKGLRTHRSVPEVTPETASAGAEIIETAIIDYLTNVEGGWAGVEDMRKALPYTRNQLAGVLTKAVAAGRFLKRGEKRKTEYALDDGEE